MFGKNKNKYNLYPNCPKCQTKGPLTTKGIRQCLNGGCKVELYWKGGSTNEKTVSEQELHKGKEDIMSDVLKRYKKD